MNCDFCGKDWCTDEGGVITMHEKAPLAESMDDEIYNFCRYRCLTRWIKL